MLKFDFAKNVERMARNSFYKYKESSEFLQEHADKMEEKGFLWDADLGHAIANRVAELERGCFNAGRTEENHGRP